MKDWKLEFLKINDRISDLNEIKKLKFPYFEDEIPIVRELSDGQLRFYKIRKPVIDCRVVKKADVLNSLTIPLKNLPKYSACETIKKITDMWFLMVDHLNSEVNIQRNKFDSENIFPLYQERKMLYFNEYLMSPEWAIKRQMCLSIHGTKCLKCGADYESIHHISYENIGDEDPKNDLIPICVSCHKKEHNR